MCDINGTDPFTMDARLCDDDRMVRRGAMHHGTDYLCTGHAHQFGQHIRCTNPEHYRVTTASVAPTIWLEALQASYRLWPPNHAGVLLPVGTGITTYLGTAP